MTELDNFVAKLDACKRTSDDGGEYWMARDLRPLLGYATWDRFEPVISRARAACVSSGVPEADQFCRTANVISAGKGAQLERADWFLSRYACYLIGMNGDPTKRQVGFAQTYFAVQTRLQEAQKELSEVERRAMLRERVRDANVKLSKAARRANVQKYAVFQNAGYEGLYGMGLAEVRRRKRLQPTEDLLDCADRAELAANEFRITQTEQKLDRDHVRTEQAAIHVHHDVGRHVRHAIRNMNGTMPEDLPPAPDITKLVPPKRRKELAAEALSQPTSVLLKR